MKHKQALPVQVRVELEVIAMKGYSTLNKSPELEPRHQNQSSVIPRTTFCKRSHTLQHKVESEYSKPRL